MRIAAGILMITYGLKAIGFLVSSLSAGFIDYRFPWGLSVIILAVILAVFIITGGVFCLKRKYWKICFASSLVLLLFMIFDVNFLFPFPVDIFTYELIIPLWVHIPLSLPWGILPQIFVCLRRSEW